MSMCMSLVAVSDANIERLLGDPPLVWRVIAPDDPEPYESARADAVPTGLLSKLLGRAPAAREEADLQLSAPEGDAVDIDKAWHGLHYLLTGTAWEGTLPHNFLVGGGTEVGAIDVGYGPARALPAAATREVRDALQSLSNDALRARFDGPDMMTKKIYPEIWDEEPAEDDTLGYLMEHLEALRGFLDRTVEQRLGVVIYLS